MMSLAIAFSFFMTLWGVVDQPLTNGSFEQLRADGFPVDWEAVGLGVSVTDDARTGAYALRFERTTDIPERIETGINRAWHPHSNTGGAMLTQVTGGFEFWYKANAIDGATVMIGAIPMTAEPYEAVGAQRTLFTVPDQYADGEWRKGVVQYDYSDIPEVRYIHFSVRVMGQYADIIVDDIQWVEVVNAFPELTALWLDEEPEGGLLYSWLRNIGGKPAETIHLNVSGPEDVWLKPVDAIPDVLHPGDTVLTSWLVSGDRTQAGEYRVDVAFDEEKANTVLLAEPSLVLESFGPVEPVAVAGEPVVLACALYNDSPVGITSIEADFTINGKTYTVSLPSLAPQEHVVLQTPAGVFGLFDEETTILPELTIRAGNVDHTCHAKSRILVTSVIPHPGVVSAHTAEQRSEGILLKNAHSALAFPNTTEGFGPARLWTWRNDDWVAAGWLPLLSRIVYRDTAGNRVEKLVYADADNVSFTKDESGCSVRFPWSYVDEDGVTWSAEFVFHAEIDSPIITTHYTMTVDGSRDLLLFDGPMLYVTHRDEALYPGLEWLVDNEVSSSTLDIEEGHPHQIRYVVHPHMVTIPSMCVVSEEAGSIGLVWDPTTEWVVGENRPASVFASPDRWDNQRSHLMGLFVPSVLQYVAVNEREAEMPFTLDAGQHIVLNARILADGSKVDVLAAMEDYIACFGLPEPEPLPHGGLRGELDFSMQAYLESLWDEETRQWWSTKRGHPLMSYKTRPREYVADLLLGALYTQDEALRKACMERVELVREDLGISPRYDLVKYGERVDQSVLSGMMIPGLQTGWDADGGRRFDARRMGTGVFEGYIYRTLGEHGMEAIGLNAVTAYAVLRYARIAGDWSAYESMVPVLEYMEKFRVPRAAQVWEVPVHTPDILAAAEAADAYLEAYRFSGEERWLANAVFWARRGIPFVYVWTASEYPFMLGGSIPVFGATFHTYSWFGQPVQWNGLRYAESILRLAEYDNSAPWRHLAAHIVHSAVHQQDLEGEDIALWPDWVNVISGEKCPWVFAPRQILGVIAMLEGRDESWQTVILGTGRERIHISAPARIEHAVHEGDNVEMIVQFPEYLQGAIIVSNVSRPDAVLLDGVALDERQDLETTGSAGWRYAPELAGLTVYIPHDKPATVHIQGVEYYTVDRLPSLVTKIDFSFKESFEGWFPANHLEQMQIADGTLQVDITGADPYMIRSNMQIDADTVDSIHIRMRLTEGQTGQLYWATEEAPFFAEERMIPFQVVTDGEWHDYHISVKQHAGWRGQQVTAIRLDPGNGARRAEAGVDFVRSY